jgi:hypothetical protein
MIEARLLAMAHSTAQPTRDEILADLRAADPQQADWVDAMRSEFKVCRAIRVTVGGKVFQQGRFDND